MASRLRTVLRQRHLTHFIASRRFASSTPPPSSSPLEQAQRTAQSAFTTASKAAGSALAAAQRATGPLGARLGSLLGSYREPLRYNLSVVREFLTLVYRAERLAPPMSVQTWSTAYATLAQRARSPAYWRDIARNGEWAQLTIYAIQAYGIFKIGEIVGRRSLVGYKIQ